jgi:hypothetical protein
MPEEVVVVSWASEYRLLEYGFFAPGLLPQVLVIRPLLELAKSAPRSDQERENAGTSNNRQISKRRIL